MPSSTRSIIGPVALTFALASLIAPQSPLAAQQPAAPVGAYDASPYLGEIRNTVLYGDIWERPQLSPRDRSLITVAVTQALYATYELRIHIGRALDNGVTQSEIAELIGPSVHSDKECRLSATTESIAAKDPMPQGEFSSQSSSSTND